MINNMRLIPDEEIKNQILHLQMPKSCVSGNHSRRVHSNTTEFILWGLHLKKKAEAT